MIGGIVKTKANLLIAFTLILVTLQIAPSHATQVFKFPATMDTGIQLGQYWGTLGKSAPSEPTIRFNWYSNSYGAGGDTGYFFFGNFENLLNGATANQLVSARMAITWESGFLCSNTNIVPTLLGSSWSEGSVSGTSQPAEVTTDVIGLAPTLVPNAKYFADVTASVRKHLTGTQNFGFGLRRSGDRCNGGDTAQYFTRESTDVNSHPYLEIVVDFSRPAYPIPTDPPSGLVLSAQTKAVVLNWSAIPVNTLNVNVEFSCSLSGIQTVVVPSGVKEATRSGLISGERCTARASSSNAAGASMFSMSTSQVIVVGTPPAAAPVSVLGMSNGVAAVTLSNVTSDTTEILVTLACSVSGRQTLTVISSQRQANFSGIREGESCSAFAQSKNEWGDSSLGPVSNSVTLRGNAPDPISFVSDSPQEGIVRLVWTIVPQNVTAIDVSLFCQKSGQFSRTLAATERNFTFTNLSGNEACTPSLSATNQWGSSIRTSNSAVIVRGAVPVTPRITLISSNVPEELLVVFSTQSDADTVEIVINCSSTGNKSYTNIKPTEKEQRFTGLRARDNCSAAVLARNTWGASALSAFAGPVEIKGSAPAQSPSGLSVTSRVGQFIVSWTSAPANTQVEISTICSQSGQRKVSVSNSTFKHTFSAIGGEICSASVASKNDWGVSVSSARTKSIVIAKSSAPAGKQTPPGVKTSLTCVQGGKSQTVTGIKPQCPTGWKKKPASSRG
jgi:hypothetical protein